MESRTFVRVFKMFPHFCFQFPQNQKHLCLCNGHNCIATATAAFCHPESWASLGMLMCRACKRDLEIRIPVTRLAGWYRMMGAAPNITPRVHTAAKARECSVVFYDRVLTHFQQNKQPFPLSMETWSHNFANSFPPGKNDRAGSAGRVSTEPPNQLRYANIHYLLPRIHAKRRKHSRNG